MTINKSLSWNNHIDNITKKANQTLAFLRRNINMCSRDSKEQAYKNFVRPTLEYASSVWNPHTTRNINAIEKVQRRAVRFTTGIYHGTSTEPLTRPRTGASSWRYSTTEFEETYWPGYRTSYQTTRRKLFSVDPILADVARHQLRGTVLGPFLFPAYINNMSSCIQSPVRLFADDFLVYTKIRSTADCEKLQEDLQKLQDWEGGWLMLFHPERCEVITISIRKNPIHGHNIQHIDNAKY